MKYLILILSLVFNSAIAQNRKIVLDVSPQCPPYIYNGTRNVIFSDSIDVVGQDSAVLHSIKFSIHSVDTVTLTRTKLFINDMLIRTYTVVENDTMFITMNKQPAAIRNKALLSIKSLVTGKASFYLTLEYLRITDQWNTIRLLLVENVPLKCQTTEIK